MFKITRRTRQKKPTKHYSKHKEVARAFVHAHLAMYADKYGFKYNRVAIRNSKRSWGSCSEHGNLNFHYKIIFLPQELASYLMVHELCHLKEFNHSVQFWAHVEEIIPNYKECRKRLKEH
ncbi:MAG: M48 family metallopeptidase [Parcubacteria group bacterium]|nr:M48 family metallopeptidase [Parcubacteria group bacterium]